MNLTHLTGIPLQLLTAVVVDLLIGDPRWIPHPIRAIGFLIDRSEKTLRKFTKSNHAEFFYGAVMVIFVVLITFGIFYLISYYMNIFLGNIFIAGGRFALSDIVIGVIGSFSLAYKGLRDSVCLILQQLKAEDTVGARKALSLIVGRDTERLESEGIVRAAIESLSENLSDGVIAPMFYFAIGGLPLAFAYKAINTIDSMVGYKNDRYQHFGKFGAKLDDAANYIPARLTAFFIIFGTVALKFLIMVLYPLICIIDGDTESRAAKLRRLSVRKSMMILLRDGDKHTSPNAGRPEAAIAGALSIALGGTSTYGGMMVEKPVIGNAKKTADLTKIDDAISVSFFAAIIGFVTLVTLSIYVRGFLF
ncbi:adenosylcobinamide-phosphate synthase CbiB [Candidatus Magnetomonas plexicatena]|uniref:adenosylcobinamide-phosphate synthase CbiB n=1 Tax=Candidatus Magnetomonas plexicatena TaxID=2552947 RepID=UPI001102655F|nr:cobalamin biosynthesis protein CobD [Nitrospirales bacterium LBB_01]